MTPTPKRRYRIFPSYISSNGTTIHSGEYDETEIDVDEARKKSTALLVNAASFQSVKPITDSFDLNMTPTNDINFQNKSTLFVVEVKRLKINSCSTGEIEAIKYVGKVAAQKIYEARKDAKIRSYTELDKIAPIKGNKTWADIAVIDFELPEPTFGLVYEGLKTFGYSTENVTQPTSA